MTWNLGSLAGGAIRHPLDPDRWPEERQYLRNDTPLALVTFQRRRGEVLMLLQSLTNEQWQRVGIHLSKGRLPLSYWVAILAAHDDKHLGQIRVALEHQT